MEQNLDCNIHAVLDTIKGHSIKILDRLNVVKVISDELQLNIYITPFRPHF